MRYPTYQIGAEKPAFFSRPDLFDYIEPFSNRRRSRSTLGYASPMKFLEDWISTQHAQQLAA
jgi:putative transposase